MTLNTNTVSGHNIKGVKFRIGCRRSPLALKQAVEIVEKLNFFYPAANYEVAGIDTYGDKDKTTPISEIEGTDFFTREIEEALLDGRIDFAVHSAKDMPDELPKGLTVAAMTRQIDPYDALVSRDNLTIDQLPLNARIGSSSLRRKAQLKKYRSDLQIIDIRGNIDERLEKLDELDAVIVAACALIRLGLEGRIAQRIPLDILTPHPLQGALAIEVREGDSELIKMLKVLDGA